MASLINITAIILYFSIKCVLAILVSSNNGGSFSLPAIYGKNIARDPLEDVRNARLKYRENNDSTLGKRQDSSTPSNFYKGIYLTPVTLGGNQVLKVNFDTASADFWVYSTLYPGSSPDSKFYNSSLSSTYEAQQATFDVTYSDGSSASGAVGTETVTVGGTTVTGQWFGLPSDIAFSAWGDGVLGLGFSGPSNTIRPGPQKTFFENAQSALTKPVFTTYLPFSEDGTYTFGDIDASKYTGTLSYAPVNSAIGLWQFDSESYMVGSTVYNSTGTKGYADTTSSHIFMQNSQVTNYYANVSGAVDENEVWVFPCNASLPTLSFLIGPTVYASIDGKYLIYDAQDSRHITCVGSLQSLGNAGANVLLNTYGLPFFNAYYTVFDASVPQLGFAPCINC